MEEQKTYQISRPLLQGIINYLQEQKYIDVAMLLDGIMKEVVPQDEEKEKPPKKKEG